MAVCISTLPVLSSIPFQKRHRDLAYSLNGDVHLPLTAARWALSLSWTTEPTPWRFWERHIRRANPPSISYQSINHGSSLPLLKEISTSLAPRPLTEFSLNIYQDIPPTFTTLHYRAIIFYTQSWFLLHHSSTQHRLQSSAFRTTLRLFSSSTQSSPRHHWYH